MKPVIFHVQKRINHLNNQVVNSERFSRLGFALWPELHSCDLRRRAEFSRLGFALWPEHGRNERAGIQ